MLTGVVDVAWKAAGRPEVVAPDGAGPCARCGQVRPLSPTRTTVSKFFRGWDSWHDPNGSGVCPACTWSYRSPLLRAVPHRIHRDPAMLSPQSSQDLTELLTREGLSDADAVVIPLHPARKHLLQLAQWGMVTTDQGTMPWTDDDAHRLMICHQLRHLGFTSRDLALPAPPWERLRSLPAETIGEVLSCWAALEPWRHCPQWLAIAACTEPLALMGHNA